MNRQWILGPFRDFMAQQGITDFMVNPYDSTKKVLITTSALQQAGKKVEEVEAAFGRIFSATTGLPFVEVADSHFEHFDLPIENIESDNGIENY